TPITVEPLESRIAPAVIFIGGPKDLTGHFPIQDTQYDTGTPLNPDTRPTQDQGLLFISTFDRDNPAIAASDPISQAVDDPGVSNTYYLKLTKGDEVFAFHSSHGYNDFLINVVSGNVIAFFTDLNNNGVYDDGELTGLALGKNASVQLGGTVNGP